MGPIGKRSALENGPEGIIPRGTTEEPDSIPATPSLVSCIDGHFAPDSSSFAASCGAAFLSASSFRNRSTRERMPASFSFGSLPSAALRPTY